MKKKIIIIIVSLLVGVLVFINCVGTPSCTVYGGNTPGCSVLFTKKYDVTVKIESDVGNTWIFAPDTDEITEELRYSGYAMRVRLDEYQLKDHPEVGNQWLTPYGKNTFSCDYFYTDLDGKQNKEFYIEVKERGTYSFVFTTNKNSTLFKQRRFELIINVV